MAKSMQKIASMLQNTKFKRKWFGGIDEEDLWKKLEHLQREYAELIREERLKNEGAVRQCEKIASSFCERRRERDDFFPAELIDLLSKPSFARPEPPQTRAPTRQAPPAERQTRPSPTQARADPTAKPAPRPNTQASSAKKPAQDREVMSLLRDCQRDE